MQFGQTLIQATPTNAVTVVSKPGFRDGATGFVMPTRMYGSVKGCFLWDADFSDPAFGEIKGDLTHFSDGVLKPALLSLFASFAILIALAAPLPSYTEQKDDKGKLLPEGAIFDLAGESSGEKTTFERMTQSIYGSPDIMLDYEATPRGVAEGAYARNDLVVALDDTENGGFLSDSELLRVMKSFNATSRSSSTVRQVGAA